jgi:PqqD family protein of HPr-rel-A system
LVPEKWAVPEDCRLEWRQWGSFHVVFNPASGDTHLLNTIPAYFLKSLETKAATLEELRLLAAELLDRDPDETVVSDIEALVLELDELGLIAPARS